MLSVTSHQKLGLDPLRWDRAVRLIKECCERGLIPAAGLVVGRGGQCTGPYLFGRQTIADGSPPIRDDAMFLVASVTKPVVAMGCLLLVERGRIALSDRVADFLPDFGRQGKYAVTLRHLLTHTSGLPDMLPNNRELRAGQAPLDEFVRQTCEIHLDFPAGRGVQYQSMGFAVLGEIIARVTGKPCAEFLRDELFLPLGMHDAVLGLPEDWITGPTPRIDRIPEIRVPPDQQEAADWNWNSLYWRRLGAPWGGLFTTPLDLARFAQVMLDNGLFGESRLFSRATVNSATRNQLQQMTQVPEDDRRCRPWGLGWRLHWPEHRATFGDLVSPRTYGHWGATGSVLWIDPEREAYMVLVTTEPLTGQSQLLTRISNAVAAALP